MGKVKAMADWKLMLRVWGAWRSHVRGRRLEVETELHERNIIEAERSVPFYSCSQIPGNSGDERRMSL